MSSSPFAKYCFQVGVTIMGFAEHFKHYIFNKVHSEIMWPKKIYIKSLQVKWSTKGRGSKMPKIWLT